MQDVWKIIKDVEYDNMQQCVELLLKKNYVVSHWIRDIAKNTKTNFKEIIFPVELFRVKVSDLGIN